jgi:hypothetical protein
LRILAIHSANHPDQEKRSAVDAWRLGRPIAELRKHTDWHIDERQTVIPDLMKYANAKEFTPDELDRAFKDLTSYDVVISTYQSNPTIYTLLQVAQKRSNMQYILDCDDDMFAINPDNPVWLAVKDEHIYYMQRMIADCRWLNTTTEGLAKVFRTRRKGHHKDSVMVTPNYISDTYKEYDPDNGDKLMIGFFGGSSHYGDLHRTGCLEAIQRLMHNYKHIQFKSTGMVIDTYLPKARVIIGDAKKGDAWTDEIFPSLNLDIAIGPLEDNLFNAAKSNIKWQEATRAGAAFVASHVGPYKTLPKGTATTTGNSINAWYAALEPLVLDADKRRTQVQAARIALQKHYRLEDHWQAYKQLFETVTAKRPAVVQST